MNGIRVSAVMVDSSEVEGNTEGGGYRRYSDSGGTRSVVVVGGGSGSGGSGCWCARKRKEMKEARDTSLRESGSTGS